jgi:hypothetical protein
MGGSSSMEVAHDLGLRHGGTLSALRSRETPSACLTAKEKMNERRTQGRSCFSDCPEVVTPVDLV